mgnify:CR=1 FL=1
MTDTLVNNSNEIVETVVNTVEYSSPINWWMWFAIIEFVIILFLILNRKTKSKISAKNQFKKDALSEEVDFNNIINSSFNSSEIYDELKVKCHPDRFPIDKEKSLTAESIFQEIVKNKNNIKRLLELKEEAINKLNIKF